MCHAYTSYVTQSSSQIILASIVITNPMAYDLVTIQADKRASDWIGHKIELEDETNCVYLI